MREKSACQNTFQVTSGLAKPSWGRIAGLRVQHDTQDMLHPDGSTCVLLLQQPASALWWEAKLGDRAFGCASMQTSHCLPLHHCLNHSFPLCGVTNNSADLSGFSIRVSQNPIFSLLHAILMLHQAKKNPVLGQWPWFKMDITVESRRPLLYESTFGYLSPESNALTCFLLLTVVPNHSGTFPMTSVQLA